MSATTPTTTAETTSAPDYKRKALFAAAVGYGLDGFDLLILSFALSGIIVTFGLSDVQAGSLSTITLLGAVLGGIVYSQLIDPTALLVGGFFMGAFANGMLGGHGALLAEMFPTQIRATAQNVIFNIGRALGGLAPVVIALLANSFGFAFALALLPAIYVIQFLAMFMLPEKRGVELE